MEHPRLIRNLRRMLRTGIGLAVLYFLCLLFPQPFFPKATRQRNLVIYAPVSPALFQDVNDRLRRSPLNDTTVTQRVFICSSTAQFCFFTRGRTNLGGLCDNRLTRNIFIHPADLRTGHMRAPLGDPRPLSYFIAHEITHSMESRFVGRWSLRVPNWLWEGYAEYIGDPNSLEHYLALYREGSPLMDPTLGGYDRYALYVTFLLDYAHRDIRELLHRPPARDSVEVAIRTLVRSR